MQSRENANYQSVHNQWCNHTNLMISIYLKQIWSICTIKEFMYTYFSCTTMINMCMQYVNFYPNMHLPEQAFDKFLGLKDSFAEKYIK